LLAIVKHHLTFQKMPLAVYREVAAHLRQVDGITTGLLPQTSPEFDYTESQIGALWLEHPTDLDALGRQRLVAILNHYQQQYPLADPLPLAAIAPGS